MDGFKFAGSACTVPSSSVSSTSAAPEFNLFGSSVAASPAPWSTTTSPAPSVFGTVGLLGKFASVTYASTPSVSGTTTVPRVRLSYRWTIDDADVFLEEGNIKSPAFTGIPQVVALGLGTTSDLWTKWCLSIKKSTAADRVLLSLEAIVSGKKKKSMQGVVFGQHDNILVSDCKFSFIDSHTSEVKYVKKAPLTECYQNHYNKELGVEIEVAKPESYICDGALTIQVDATLLEVCKSQERVDQVREVSVDSIRSEMHSLFQKSVLADATIKCGDKEFKVHKIILASQSPVFRKRFETNKAGGNEEVDLSDYSQAVVSEFITYLYTGSAPNIGSLANDLIIISNVYELRRLFVMCQDELMMKIKVSEVVDLLTLADTVKAQNLKRACMNFICLNLAQVQKTTNWEEMKSEEKYKDLIYETFENSAIYM